MAAEWWNKISAPVRSYLLCRAADFVSFGDRYSSLPQATFAPYEVVVGALVSLSKDTKVRAFEAEEKEEAATERQRIEKECAEKVARISYSPPAILESRVLAGSEIQEIREACVKQLNQDQNTCNVAATIDEFVAFCDLLSKPENQVKVRTGQFIEREVPMRQEVDMVHEVVRLLTGLPKYTAFAKILQGQDVWKGKIQTLPLSTPLPSTIRMYPKANNCGNERSKIEQEVQERQENWKIKIQDATIGAPSKQIDEPPPKRY